MNKIAISALSLCLITSGALASEKEDAASSKQLQSTETRLATEQPVQLTDDQLDQVSGGLITVVVVDLIDVDDVTVAVPVQATIGVAALGGAVVQNTTQRPGRVR